MINKTQSLIIVILSTLLTSALADTPLWANQKTWVENETHILLLHSKIIPGPPYNSGKLRLISKKNGITWFDKEVGYLTYAWISPDSKFIVGFSARKPFYDMAGFNLIILNSNGDILHKKLIGYGSKDVKNVSHALSEWVEFYDYREGPNIELEYDKLGNVIAISFNDAASERARITLGKSILDQNIFKKKILEVGQESLNEMIQNQILDPTWTTPVLKAKSDSQAGQD